MKRVEGFTPVLPLSRAQATWLSTSSANMDTFTAKATLLLDVAADHREPGQADAATMLTELAELIESHTAS